MVLNGNSLSMAGKVTDILTSAGYKFKGTCQCDGFLTYKYIDDEGNEIRWRKNAHKFRISPAGKQRSGWLPLTVLYDKIIESII